MGKLRQKTYRQLRTRVTRLRRRHRAAGSSEDPFEVFGQDTDVYQRVGSAESAASLADELAQRNPGQHLHVWHDNEHCYEVVCADGPEPPVPEQFEVSFTCLSEFLGVEPEVYGVTENFQVEIYTAGTGRWFADLPEGIDLDPKFNEQEVQYLYRYCVLDRQRQLEAVAQQENKMSKKAGFDSPESLARELVLWVDNDATIYERALLPVWRNMTRKMAQNRYDPELAVKGFMYAAVSGAKSYAREFGGVWYDLFPPDIRRLAAEMLRDEFEAEVEAAPESFEEHVLRKDLPEWRKRYKESDVRRKAFADPATIADILDIQDASRPAMADWFANYIDPGAMATPADSAAALAQEAYDTWADDWTEFPREDVLDVLEAAADAYLDLYIRAATTRSAVGRTNKEGETMTRKPSRARRRRLANRVERSRTRSEEKRREAKREERQAQKTDNKQDRLKRRVATLRTMLRKAQRDLRNIDQAPKELEREARVREIRERIARARKQRERLAKREERQASRRPAAQPTKPQKREAAPKYIKRKQDGKVYVRMD